MSWFDTIYADNDVSAHAKAIYMYLKHRGNTEGKSFPSVPTMARELHLSQSSIRRALTELVEHHYIARDPRYRRSGARSSNLYTVLA